MNLFAQVEDPTDLTLVREVIAKSANPSALVPLGIRKLEISPEAADHTAASLIELLEATGRNIAGARVVVLQDATPIFKGKVDLKAAVAAQLEAHFRVEVVVLGDDHHLYADDTALNAATAAVLGATAVVSVGSGTISDIAKVASNRAGNLPYVMVQTAASVDGYTDNVSVVLRNGAKRTIDSRWPDVVLADTQVIETAPRQLNTSGFGELLSLFTAPADWWLAFQAGTDKTFHTTPRDLLLTFAGNPGEWGQGISEGNREAVEQLTRVLAIRGIGTGIAGTTACLSGMEHLVSHMLDMHAAAHHQETGLHGTQVGIASVVAASAWEYLLDQIRAGRPNLLSASVSGAASKANASAASLDLALLEAQVKAVFAECDPSGAMGAECWRDYSAKLTALTAGANALIALTSNAETLVAALGATLPNAKNLAQGLALAGAASNYRQLDSWVTPEIWRWAVSNCHFMRNRVTIVDLLNALGWWTDADIDAVLARVEALTGEAANV